MFVKPSMDKDPLEAEFTKSNPEALFGRFKAKMGKGPARAAFFQAE